MQFSLRRKRRAVSELMGTLIMVTITLVAGFAIFGYVNGQAAVAENQYGQSVANNVNYLQEHFVIVAIQFYYTSNPSTFQYNPCTTISGQQYCNEISVSIYNNGAVGLTLSQIALANVGSTSASGATVPTLSITSTATSTGGTCGSATGSPGSGFAPSQTQPIAINSVPPTVFNVILPSYCSGSLSTSGILDGGSYAVTALASYGNQIVTRITANG